MYKKISILLSISGLLLLPGCLDKVSKPEAEIEIESAPARDNNINNIAAEETTEMDIETEILPEQIEQAPSISQQASATVIHLSSSSQLDDLINQGNVIIDFYATWCGPCKSVSPIIDTLAKQYAGKVLFVKVDVDKFKDISAKFNIKGMPTFYFFKDGNKVDSFAGARDKQAFEQKIKSHFNL